MECEYMGSTRGSRILSSADDVLDMGRISRWIVRCVARGRVGGVW